MILRTLKRRSTNTYVLCRFMSQLNLRFSHESLIASTLFAKQGIIRSSGEAWRGTCALPMFKLEMIVAVSKNKYNIHVYTLATTESWMTKLSSVINSWKILACDVILLNYRATFRRDCRISILRIILLKNLSLNLL